MVKRHHYRLFSLKILHILEWANTDSFLWFTLSSLLGSPEWCCNFYWFGRLVRSWCSTCCALDKVFYFYFILQLSQMYSLYLLPTLNWTTDILLDILRILMGLLNLLPGLLAWKKDLWGQLEFWLSLYAILISKPSPWTVFKGFTDFFFLVYPQVTIVVVAVPEGLPLAVTLTYEYLVLITFDFSGVWLCAIFSGLRIPWKRWCETKHW